MSTALLVEWAPTPHAPLPLPPIPITRGVVVIQLAEDREGVTVIRVWHARCTDGVLDRAPTLPPLDVPRCRAARRLWVRVIAGGQCVALHAMQVR